MGGPVRLGIIGLGSMGTAHAETLGSLHDLRLAAVCDQDPGRAAAAATRFGVPGFTQPAALLAARCCDAALVATPHYDHTSVGIQLLKAGLHVLMEKPISVHKADAERLVRAHRGGTQVFAAMFNQRVSPAFRQLRDLLDSGRLGAVRRVHWTITDWFRSSAYYASGGWRATWAGEGGGVLLNQSPHQLDLLQWLFGMPSRLQAFCHFGKHHRIEVEDEVTAYLEWPGGATGVFVTSTGEAPGSNRLEVATEQARVVLDAEEGDLVIRWNDKPVSRAIAENASFETPDTRLERLPVDGDGGQHRAILANFAAAILHDAPLIAPAAEGVLSVELANAMLLSGWTGRMVDLPISARGYAARLRRLAARSVPAETRAANS